MRVEAIEDRAVRPQFVRSCLLFTGPGYRAVDQWFNQAPDIYRVEESGSKTGAWPSACLSSLQRYSEDRG